MTSRLTWLLVLLLLVSPRAAGGGKDGFGEPLPAGARARLGSKPTAHGSYQLVFSPDGKLLAEGDGRSMLLLWDLDTGRVRHRFFLAASTIGGVAFSPDGTRLTVAYRPTNGGGEVHIYDVASGATLSRAKLPRLYSVAVSQDGRTVAVSEEELKDKQIRYVLRLYDAATGKRVRLLNRDLGGWADMLTFSADGLILVARMQKPAIRRWDTATGRELGDGPVKVLTSERQIVLSPDGKTGASQLGTAVLLWDLATGKELRRLDTKTAAVGMMGFSPDGKMVITAYHDGMVRLWDAATGQGLRRLIEEHHWFSVGALSPDGKRLACSQHARPPRVWDLTTGQELPPLAGHLTAVKSLLFSPDGKLLASTSETRKHVRLWDVAAGKQRLVISSPEAELTLPAFSPDGKVLAVCRGWQTIVLWDTATGKELRQLQGHKGWIAAVGFLADSKTLVSAGSDGTLRHWDVATGKLRAVRPGIIIRSNELSRPQFMMGQPLETGAYAAAFVAFSPDGSLLASIALEGGDWAVGNATDFYVGGKYVLRVWDTATGTKQYEVKLGEDAHWPAFSLDSRTLLLRSGGGVRLHETVTRQDRLRLSILGEKEMLSCAGLAASGRLVAAGSHDFNYQKGRVRLWDAATGKELPRLEAGQGILWSLAFSPDGRTMATGGADGTILLWDVPKR